MDVRITTETGPDRQAAEHLLFTQYRCWMAGYSTRDITCWEMAWNGLQHAGGPGAARRLYGEFQGFVRTLLETARRDLGWRPVACRHLCHDEIAVLELLRAAQGGRVLDQELCCSRLLGHDEAGPLAEASSSLARCMADHQFHLGLPAPEQVGSAGCPMGVRLH